MKKTRIRVREMKMVDASLLEPHPENFRVHTPEQRTAMDGVLNEVGFAGAVLVRELDGGRYQILDGHLRVEEMKGQQVPILVTDLSETEARKVLATFDAVGSMADVDVDWLRALIEGIEWDNKEIEKIIAETMITNSAEKVINEIEKETGENDLKQNIDNAYQPNFAVIIDCETEEIQVEMLERFIREGLECRALML